MWCWGANDGGQLGRPPAHGAPARPRRRCRWTACAAAAANGARAAAGHQARHEAAELVRDVAVGDARTRWLWTRTHAVDVREQLRGQLGRLECLIQNPADGAAGCRDPGRARVRRVLETPGAVGLVMKPRAERPGAETAGTRPAGRRLENRGQVSASPPPRGTPWPSRTGPRPGARRRRRSRRARRARASRAASRAAERPPDAVRSQRHGYGPGGARRGCGRDRRRACTRSGGGTSASWATGRGSRGHARRVSGIRPHAAALEGVARCKSRGADAAAAVDRAGRVYTWGAGSCRRQLGHGDRRPAFAPRVVRALLGVNVTSVAAGTRHTVAVDDMGETYAWGSNEFGASVWIRRRRRLDQGAAVPHARGWTQDDNSTDVDQTSARRRARSLLRIDTEDDPAGAFDLIFERCRDAPDGTGDVAHSHAPAVRSSRASSRRPPPPGPTPTASPRPPPAPSIWTPSATARTAGAGPWEGGRQRRARRERGAAAARAPAGAGERSRRRGRVHRRRARARAVPGRAWTAPRAHA